MVVTVGGTGVESQWKEREMNLSKHIKYMYEMPKTFILHDQVQCIPLLKG